MLSRFRTLLYMEHMVGRMKGLEPHKRVWATARVTGFVWFCATGTSHCCNHLNGLGTRFRPWESDHSGDWH